MPVKRRQSGEAPLQAWRMVFGAGHDYLRLLRPYGFNTPAKVMQAAPAAWDRLGAEFMQTWRKPPHEYAPKWPWAYEQFGKPGRKTDDDTETH